MDTLKLHDYQAMTEGAETIEVDPHGAKVLRLADGTMLKLFRRKRLISSAAWYPYARRFADNAATLRRLGFHVPHVIAVFRIPELARDAVRYAPLPGVTLRALARGNVDAGEKARLKRALTALIVDLHAKGIYFRSLHLGNIVVTPEGGLGLIDFADLRIHPWPLGPYLRARNLRRMQAIADERDWLDSAAIVAGRAPTDGIS